MIFLKKSIITRNGRDFCTQKTYNTISGTPNLAVMSTGHCSLYVRTSFSLSCRSVSGTRVVYIKVTQEIFFSPHPKNKHPLSMQGRNELEDVGV